MFPNFISNNDFRIIRGYIIHAIQRNWKGYQIIQYYLISPKIEKSPLHFKEGINRC
jgi:hypothetical protein